MDRARTLLDDFDGNKIYAFHDCVEASIALPHAVDSAKRHQMECTDWR